MTRGASNRRARSARMLTIAAAIVCSVAASPGSAEAAYVQSAAFTSWSHPNAVAPIRRYPNPTAVLTARTHLDTENGSPEVYPVLGRFIDDADRGWTRIAIPGRPNGRTGWVRDGALGPANATAMLLVVDRATLTATLHDRGRVVWTARTGVGAAATPTPAGSFWIREKHRVTFGASYGARAFGTSAYSRLTDWPGGGVIGIHGTDQPGLIPGRPSHGCVRLTNAAVTRLFDLMPVGTPVSIR
jgi:lipoprotein-anchoring transpeptidase ErfK/SrfK